VEVRVVAVPGGLAEVEVRVVALRGPAEVDPAAAEALRGPGAVEARAAVEAVEVLALLVDPAAPGTRASMRPVARVQILGRMPVLALFGTGPRGRVR
jgi:hypothetical protein